MMKNLSRRQFLRSSAGFGALGVSAAAAGSLPGVAMAAGNTDPLVTDEKFWQQLGDNYPQYSQYDNLANGYSGANGMMHNQVRDAYEQYAQAVRKGDLTYDKGQLDRSHNAVRQSLAKKLSVDENRLTLTAGVDDSFDQLGLESLLNKGDGVMFSDSEHPSGKAVLRQLAVQNQGETVVLQTPVMTNDQQALAWFAGELAKAPQTRVLLLSHVERKNGYLLPIKAIAQLARQHGVITVVDTTDSWGLQTVKAAELGVDRVVFNLNKWIGAPAGVGLVYRAQGDHPLFSEALAAQRNPAAVLALPSALALFDTVGPKLLHSRLVYLRDSWLKAVAGNNNVTVSAMAGQNHFAPTRVSVDGLDGYDLSSRLLDEHGFLTVATPGESLSDSIQVAPMPFTGVKTMVKFAKAINRLAA